jgi:hypothetical protein
MTDEAADQLPDAAPDDWADPEWRRHVRAWVHARLGEQGVAVTGHPEQPHAPWWSTALRLPTSEGIVWFKASRDAGVEARLTALLQQAAPDMTAELLAADDRRAWMLSRDAGTRLREHASGPAQLAHWERLLPVYGDLQVRLVPRVEELLRIGVPDLRTPRLVEQARTLAEDGAVLTTAPEDALTLAELDELRDRGLAELDRLASALADRAVPASLQHDDLHDGNVFVRDAGYVVFDWGDACVSHPFHTLVVTLRALAYQLGLAPGAPELLRLRDAYLEAWGSFGSRQELLEVAELARRTGTLQRALAWYATVQAMPADRRHEEQDSVPYGVRLFLEDAGWGAWS